MTPSKQPADLRWWLKAEDGGPIGEPHQTITAIVKQLKDSQSYRTDRDLIHMCLYGADLVQGFGVTSYTLTGTYSGSPLSVNVVRSVIDTLVAKIIKSKPRPMWLTSGADWQLQSKAKKLNRYSEGLFYENKVYRFNRAIVRDALVFGTGGARAFEGAGGKPRIERIFMPEMYVNDSEAKYGDPRSFFLARSMDRMVAAETWPDKADAIMQAEPEKVDDWQMVNSSKDQIPIVEAMHLPSSKSSGDGRYATIIPSETLEYGDWDDETPDFVVLRYAEPILGWYGTGLAQMLAGKQLEINKLLTEIQRSFHLGSNFRVMVERGSKIIKSHFTNEIGAILEYTGAAPTIAVAQTVHPEKLQHLMWLISSSFQEAGINANTAAGEKDSTLKSGKAQMVALDVEDSRYAEFGQAYEEFCMDEADLLLRTAKRAGAKPVIYVGKKEIEVVELPDMGKEKTALQVFPTSALASAPGQRMEQVQNLANAGWIPPAVAKRLLDFPELEDEANLDDAAYSILREMLDTMFEDHRYQQPLPQMDLKEALLVSVNYFLDRRRRWPDNTEGLNLIASFMGEVESMMNGDAPTDQAMPAPGGQSPIVGGPAPGMPPGPPGMPPPPMPTGPGGPPPPPNAPGSPPGMMS